MIEKTKCRSCRQTYELIWNDVDCEDWRHEFDDDCEEESDDDCDDPVYCPFCGCHMDFDE